MGSLPLMSLMSTVAWASSSRESSSVVPVRAAWCNAEKLWARRTKADRGWMRSGVKGVRGGGDEMGNKSL